MGQNSAKCSLTFSHLVGGTEGGAVTGDALYGDKIAGAMGVAGVEVKRGFSLCIHGDTRVPVEGCAQVGAWLEP